MCLLSLRAKSAQDPGRTREQPSAAAFGRGKIFSFRMYICYDLAVFTAAFRTSHFIFLLKSIVFPRLIPFQGSPAPITFPAGILVPSEKKISPNSIFRIFPVTSI